MTGTTLDAFFDGRISVRQVRDGYRFSIDAVILARHAAMHPGRRVLDLGAGCGIIGLIIAFLKPEAQVIGVEIQEELALTARANAADNGLENRLDIRWMDLKDLSLKAIRGPVDQIVANPPYRRARSGRTNPDPQKAAARHEIFATLQDIVRTGSGLLDTAGRFSIIYPSDRLPELLTLMRRAHLEPKWMRVIHSRSESPAIRVMVDGIKNGKPGMVIAPPLTVYGPDSTYTEEIRRMFSP